MVVLARPMKADAWHLSKHRELILRDGAILRTILEVHQQLCPSRNPVAVCINGGLT